MKRKCTLAFLAGILLLMVSACGSRNDSQAQNTESTSRSQDEANDVTKAEEISENSIEELAEKNDGVNNQEIGGTKMIIEVSGQQFTAKLYDNDTAAALRNMLPMTLNMEEMNGNEKYYFMDESLPSATENVGTIKNGDIMLYGSDCLVLFFKTFDTSYTYTRIGHIEDAEGFAAALERGTVEISFHMKSLHGKE